MDPVRLNHHQRGTALRFAVLGNLVPVAIATATGFGSHRTIFFAGAIGACIAPIVVTAVDRRHRLIFYLGAFGGIPALVALQAFSGGAASGYSLLVMMAMVWFGLQATDRELLAGVVLLAGCSYLPMLVIGPPAYPVEWGHATLIVLVGVAVAGSLRAVTREMQRLTRKLRRQALADDLTGLLNRRGWTLAAEQELARATRSDSPLAIVLLDLDCLKEVNDSRGHDEGDQVLRETADRMRSVFRASDVLARLGGDEFVSLLESSVEQALAAVRRLEQATPKLGSFSAGVAAWDGAEPFDELLRRVDVALYAAKAAGGGGVEVAEPLTLAAELERSLPRA